MSVVGWGRAGLIRAAVIVALVLSTVVGAIAGEQPSEDWLREELRLHFEINRMAVLQGETTIEEADKEDVRMAGELAGDGYSEDRLFELLAFHRQEMARLVALVERAIRQEPVWPDNGLAPEEHAMRARILLEKIRVDDNALRVVGGDLRAPEMEAEALLHYADGVLAFPPAESVFFDREARIQAALAGLPGVGAAPAAEDGGQAVDEASTAKKKAVQEAAKPDARKPAGGDALAALPGIVGQLVAAGVRQDPAAACNGFAGLWQTGAGPLLMDANGLGTYDAGTATIWGIVEGRKLTGPFQEVAKEGTVSITLSEDGRNFSGTWSFPNGDWGGDWSGDCVAGVGDAPAVQAMVAGAAGAALGDAALQIALDAFDQILAAAAADAPAEPAQDQAAKGPLHCTGFEGRWGSNYGEMFIAADPADANRLTGTYVDGDGQLSGTVNGGTFEGTFSQPGFGEGSFILTLSDDGYTFTGSWTQTDGGTGGGEWNGTCLEPAAG